MYIFCTNVTQLMHVHMYIFEMVVFLKSKFMTPEEALKALFQNDYAESNSYFYSKDTWK